jgi:hypothetical protein
MPDNLGFLVGVLIAVVLLGVLAHFLYNLAKPTVTRKARVIGKRKTQGSSTAECTFEFEDGTRQYYNVSLDTYVSLAEGDVGDLSTRGLVFWGFRREGEAAPSGPPRGASISEESMAQIKEALFQGRKIEAIRLYRECTGTGLGEAKATVDRLEAELRAAEPDKFDRPS